MNALAILIFLVSFDALSGDFAGGKNKAKCIKEMKITVQQLQIKKDSFTPDHTLKCYFRCILKRDYLITDDNIIPGAFERIVGPLLSPKKVAKVVSSCHSKKATEFDFEFPHECDYAHMLYKCYNVLTKKDLRAWLRNNKKLQD